MLHLKRPKIGVTGPDSGGSASWLMIAINILLQGGWPIRITPSRYRKIDGLHGLIISGGADVDPETYHTDTLIKEYVTHPLDIKRYPWYKRIYRFLKRLTYSLLFVFRRLLRKKKNFGIDKNRDRLEFYLTDEAVKKDLPILGICRGMQLINIYFKGNLYADIEPFYVEEINVSSIFPVKKVFIERKSKLYSIFKCHAIKVNALHHQAVREPGEGIKIVGWELNGLVQAIESTKHDFIIGVQWHPEYLPEKKRQRMLFAALIKKARKVQKKPF